MVERNMQKNNPNNLKRNYTYFAVKKEREIHKISNCLTPREHYPQKNTNLHRLTVHPSLDVIHLPTINTVSGC